MADTITVPVKKHDKRRWGDLSALFLNHQIVCEEYRVVNEKYSFAGGHRVRLFKMKKNVHFLIGDDTELDISQVPTDAPPAPARRLQRIRGR